MPLTELNHFLVLTKDIDASRRFYVEALGLRDAPRPWAPFPGAWLAIGERVCLHLAQADNDPDMLHHFGRSPGEPLHGSGAVDHIAFFASDMAAFEQRLTALGIPYRHRSIPQSRLEQLFVEDPDGVTIELNFPVDVALSSQELSRLQDASDGGATPAALHRLVADIAGAHLQPVVFSINARVGDSMVLQRVYSSDEAAYLVGGRKDKAGTAFGTTVLLEAGTLCSDGPDAIRANFDDHERILGLGGRSLLNVPVIADGVCIGVLNAVLPDPKVSQRHIQVLRALSTFLTRI